MAAREDESEGSKAALDLAGELAGAVVPGLGALVKGVGRGVLREWGRNGSIALRAAERSSGMSREDIRQAIEDDPRLVPLATRLLYAAGMNGHDKTLSAMGTVFGDAVREPDEMAECELILGALADLTDSHAEVLGVIARETRPPADGQTQATGPEHPALLAACDLPGRVVTLAVAALVARGMVQMNGTYFGAILYVVTDLGRVLLEVLEQHAASGE